MLCKCLYKILCSDHNRSQYGHIWPIYKNKIYQNQMERDSKRYTIVKHVKFPILEYNDVRNVLTSFKVFQYAILAHTIAKALNICHQLRPTCFCRMYPLVSLVVCANLCKMVVKLVLQVVKKLCHHRAHCHMRLAHSSIQTRDILS